MRALDYALRQGWASLRRSRTSSAFAITAIALAMTVLGALLMLTWNAERVLERWTSAAEFSVYLQDEATSEQRGAIEALIDTSGVTAGREYVSKAAALQRFRQEFAELAPLASSFEDNPFPASVEVRVQPDAERDGRTERLVRQLAALPGVADVRYDRQWIERLAGALETVRGAGLIVVAVMVLAAAVTVATVVRLGLYARRAEIEIMELVGSPLGFIRGPFVAEGVLQGGIGAILALVVLAAAYFLTLGWWDDDVRAFLEGGSLEFLPARLGIYVVAGGMMVGGLGGLAASRHAGQAPAVRVQPVQKA
jgi:cell division transport system permease protein